MTFHTISQDELEQLAFDSGATIRIGTHAAFLTIGDREYRARIQPIGGAL